MTYLDYSHRLSYYMSQDSISLYGFDEVKIMLKRKILNKLESWRHKGENKCLIVEGARQVGKTYIVREFGKQYKSFIEINFIENPSLKNIFTGDLDPDTIMTGIGLYMPGAEFIDGDTLLFLDEIQECDQAITSLKFLAQDHRFSVICSGSALGMVYKPNSSYPVGSVDYAYMQPLDFEEFLWALGISDDIITNIRKYLEERSFEKIPAAINDRMSDLLRQYMVLGGMPEVIQCFVDKHDYMSCDTIQRRLYQDYLNDIARYAAPDVKIKAEKCYKSIPMQLSKANHKYQYSKVEHGGNTAKFGSSVDWLINAHMAIVVNNVSIPEYPLEGFTIDNNFRLYPNDIGFLICTYGYEIKAAILADKTIEKKPDDLVLGTAKGGIYEALAAEMLTKSGHRNLHFYKSETGTIEMEFLIEGQDGIIPIEIKAGRNKSRSLSELLKNNKIKYGYKFSSQNAGIAGKKITLPLWLLAFL